MMGAISDQLFDDITRGEEVLGAAVDWLCQNPGIFFCLLSIVYCIQIYLKNMR